jgi:polyhydroxyalkanoate synthesis regulator phasin
MAEPDDMILPLLREIRASIEASSQKADKRFDRVEARLAALEEQSRAAQHARTAETLFGKLVTGEFEERIESLERQVRELQDQR